MRLRPVLGEAYDRFVARQVADYAAAKVRAGQWSPAEAVERSMLLGRRLQLG